MKLGLILYSTDPETLWNALRLGILALANEDEVSIFLLASGVEAQSLEHETFNVAEKLQEFAAKGGRTQTCGTCLKLREQAPAAFCESSTMGRLYDLIVECDKTVTF